MSHIFSFRYHIELYSLDNGEDNVSEWCLAQVREISSFPIMYIFINMSNRV